jgi:hypothetical protein
MTTMQRRLTRPAVAFSILALACVLVAAGYIGWAALRAQEQDPASQAGPPSTPADAAGIAKLRAGRSVAFISAGMGRDTGKASLLPLDQPAGTRLVTELRCDRIYQAAGRGLCLVTEPGFVLRYWALFFDEAFRETSRIELFGPPSRARVSADGRYGATTAFTFGHSYADNAFSTATALLDMQSGSIIALLEELTLIKDGQEVESLDVNYWGVTFADDSNRFYATVRTGGRTYLVEGDIAARRMEVIHENVECPSLSPDGTRIAYKKRVGELGDWRFTVLDLATKTETPLTETASIDDQLEWLDDRTLLYGKGEDLWTMPADGTGAPSLLIHGGSSPVVDR